MLQNFKDLLKNNLHFCKQPLMIAYKGFKSVRDNFGKFVYQLQPKTKRLVMNLEMILMNLYRQNVSLLLKQTCLNEGLLPTIYIYIYIYIITVVVVTKSLCGFVSNQVQYHMESAQYRG